MKRKSKTASDAPRRGKPKTDSVDPMRAKL
jgi:hypothetical protein